MAKRRLSDNQLSWLRTILNAGGEALSARSLVGPLKGKAKQFEGSYRRSLANAIAAHNEGRATNSPLPAGSLIEEAVTKHGGQGYRLIVDPVVVDMMRAVKLLEKEKNS